MSTKIISVPAKVERSATDGPLAYRSLDANSARNKSLASQLLAEVDKSHTYDSTITFPVIESEELLMSMLSELAIRFDTKPDYYTKKDYLLLISLLSGALGHLYKGGANSELFQEISDQLQLKQDKEDININYENSKFVTDTINHLLEKTDSVQKELEADSGIIITDNIVDGEVSSLTIKAAVTNDITVTGVTVGNLTPGYKIEAGTDIMSLLQAMLTKEIGCNFKDSSVSISNITKSVAYGGDINVSVTATLSNAIATSKDQANYPYSHTFSQTIESITSPSWNWAIANNHRSAEGSRLFEKVTSVYNNIDVESLYTLSKTNETDKAVNNQGKELSFAPSTSGNIGGSITIIPTLKCYVGAIDKNVSDLTSSDITSLSSPKSINLGVTSVEISGTFTNKISDKNQTLCIAVPSTIDTLSEAIDDMAFNQKDQFVGPVTVNVSLMNGTTYTYNIWTWVATGATVLINKIKLT